MACLCRTHAGIDADEQDADAGLEPVGEAQVGPITFPGTGAWHPTNISVERQTLRKILFNVHLVVGLIAAAFVVVLGVTGSIMAFEGEIDRMTHPHLFRVTPQAQPLSLAALTTRDRASVPGKITTWGLGGAPDLSYLFAATEGVVFVNQYTGEVLGTRTSPTWLDYVHQFHLRLLAGNTGKTIVSWAGVALVLLTLSGLYLWWPVKRLSINFAAGGRRPWFDLHNTVGVLSFAFLFVLSLTGIVIGFERTTTPLLYKMAGGQPSPQIIPVTPVPGAKIISPDEAIAIASRQLPGAVPIYVNVAGGKMPYRVAFRFPEDLTPGGRSRVLINPYDGKVLQVESSRATTPGAHLITLNRAIHTGDVFGLPGKLLMSLMSLAAAAQVCTGIVMWWKRRRIYRHEVAVQGRADAL